MRVLFVLTYYFPYWTGLTTYAVRLAEGLAKRGATVGVIASRHDQTLPEKETISNVTVSRLWSPIRLSRTYLMPNLVPVFLTQLFSYNAVAIFIPFSDSLVLAILAKVFGKKVIIVHNGDLVLPKGSVVNRFIQALYYVSTFMTLMISDHVVIHTADYASQSKLLRHFRHKWEVVIPPVDYFGNIQPVSHRDLRIKKVGFAGRFVEEKGFDYLLQAIPLVLQRYAHAQFVFAGERRIRYEQFYEKNKDLVEKYAKHITFLGLLTKKEDLVRYYQSLDVFVVSSRSDCFPFTQVEALLSGTPAVCTDIPGARWMVANTGMGVLVKSRSPKALADGIIEVITHRKKYAERRKEVHHIINDEQTFATYTRLFGA